VGSRSRGVAPRPAQRGTLAGGRHRDGGTIARLHQGGFFDPTAPRPDIGELQDLTRLLEQLHRLQGLALVDAYGDWWLTHPQLTAGFGARWPQPGGRLAPRIRRYLEVAA